MHLSLNPFFVAENDVHSSNHLETIPFNIFVALTLITLYSGRVLPCNDVNRSRYLRNSSEEELEDLSIPHQVPWFLVAYDDRTYK